MHDLTSHEAALLRHLKREVDHYQDAYLQTGLHHPNLKQDLQRARNELKEFVKSLREDGRNI